MSSQTEQQVRSAIHNYFREFGYDLAETIHKELMKPAGMQRILRRLAVEDPGHPDDQYAAILNFLRRNGEESFLEAIGQGRVDYRPKMQTDTTRMREIEEKQKELFRREFIRRAGTSEKAKEAPAKPAEPKAASPAPVEELPPAAKQPPPPAAPVAPEPQPPETVPGGPWDGVAERRRNKDRRTGQDRRGRVEVVFKNRRFGGDRRADKERRRG